MTELATEADSFAAFRHALVVAGLLVPGGVDGLVGWTGRFEDVVAALSRLLSAAAADDHVERVHFPPLLARWAFERTDYLRSFPQLTGSVHVFSGDDLDHAELLGRLASHADWSGLLEPSETVLRPAACHSVYPSCRGRLPEGGRRFAVSGWCYRHEPSDDPARLQTFRMHEIVYVGDPDEATAHRDLWVARGLELLIGLGLEVAAVAATDPFFGRAGRMLGAAQREEALKVEITAAVCSTGAPTALMSSNCHGDHFGSAFAIETAGGAVAHSACAGFGMERVVLALLARHGFDPDHWPAAVRARLADSK